MSDEQDGSSDPEIDGKGRTDSGMNDRTNNDFLISSISRKVEELQEEMLETFMAMLRIPAISPVNGGEGEGRKAEFILDILNTLGMDEIQVFTAEDSVPRPNIIAMKHGKDRSRRLWIMTHLDVVPPGDLTLWKSDPFEPEIRDGRIYARGSEDNGQGLMGSIFALRALNNLGIQPAIDIGLALVADEEMGSIKGIQFLLEKDIFRNDDLIIVPDAGNEDGTMLEVAEKSIMWLKVTTKGQQCHASTPEEGKNAMTAGMRFCLSALDELKKKFNDEDDIFLPPYSTFEPTKKEKNVLNINTIPGEDIFYMDCRVLPVYALDSVLDTLEMIARQVEESEGVKITMETAQREQAAPATPADAIVVRSLANAVRIVYGNEPEPIGIGGGTCAAFFRRTGCEAVVWGKIHEVAHSPNEYAVIENLIGDTKVFTLLYAGVGIVAGSLVDDIELDPVRDKSKR